MVAIALGVIGFVLGFATRPRETWIWLVVYFVIYMGLANGMLIWSAAFRVAQTRWTPAVNRIGHSALYFTPILFGMLVALLFGARYYEPWIDHPVRETAAWLNLPFMAARDIVSLVILWALCFYMVRWTLAVDARLMRGQDVTGQDQYRLTAIGTAVVMVYTVAGSVIAFDFIMSLAPAWASTMFALYYWTTSLYAGMALLIILSALMKRALGAERFLQPQQFHDMGNLLLGFSLFSMGLFFAQYLTIWYENLPEETFFMIVRYYRGIWMCPAWAAFFIGYAIPFVLLQSRTLKRSPRLCSIAAALVIIGVALERYVLVVPSVSPGTLLLAPAGLLGVLGFSGLFVLAITSFLAKYSPVSSADVALKRSDMKLEIL